MDSFYRFMVMVLCGAEVVSPCLRCFTTPAERENICTYPVSAEKMEAVDCLQRLQRGFEPLSNITIAYPQMHNIKKHLKSFGDEVKKIDKLYFPPAWVEQFEIKMAEFVKGLEDRVASHPAPQCRPPCGRQKEARTYTCSTCTVEECPFPVACPIQETKVIAYEKTAITCGGGTIPMAENPKITWKFAKNTWSSDSSIFKDMDRENGLVLVFNPAVAQHAGTYMCQAVDEDDDIIVRSFHYLHVLGIKTDESMRVSDIFNRIMKQATPPTEEEEESHVPSTMDHINAPFQSHISYGIYAGIGIMVITIVVGLLWRYALSADW